MSIAQIDVDVLYFNPLTPCGGSNAKDMLLALDKCSKLIVRWGGD